LLSPADRASSVLLALSIDDREKIQLMLDRIVGQGGTAPDYTFLSDPGHRVIDRYGLLNPSGRGWPHPATYLIDRDGVVRWKFIEVNYKIRPTNEMIVAALAKLGG
jgi:peroxiredoxin